LDLKYNIIKCVGSGSIAQVYHLKDKITNENIALKIVHPNVRREIFISKQIFLFFLFFYFYIIQNKHIPIDIYDFFKTVENQFDLKKEAINLSYFYHRYNNNKYICIPKLYDYSENIILMKYIQGLHINNLNIGFYHKSKIFIILELFLQDSILNNGLIHCDLHSGNWKVLYNYKKKDFSIIIYDFGLCCDLKNMNIGKIIENNCQNDLASAVKITIDGLINDESFDELKRKKIKSKTIIEFNNDLKEKKKSFNYFHYIIQKILKFSYENNIKINSKYINLLIILLNYDNLKNFGYNCKIESSSTNRLLNDIYPNYLFYCKHYNIFPELKKYLNDYLMKNKKKKNNKFFDLEIDIKDNYKNISYESDSE